MPISSALLSLFGGVGDLGPLPFLDTLTPLGLPETKKRKVANRDLDLGKLQTPKARRSSLGPDPLGVLNTSRRTLMGS